MFVLIEPMSVIQSDVAQEINPDEAEVFSKMFAEDVTTDRQQVVDSLFSGLED